MKKLLIGLLTLSSLSAFSIETSGPLLKCQELNSESSYLFQVVYDSEFSGSTAVITIEDKDGNQNAIEGEFIVDSYNKDEGTMFAFYRMQDDLTFTITSTIGKEMEGTISISGREEKMKFCYLLLI